MVGRSVGSVLLWIDFCICRYFGNLPVNRSVGRSVGMQNRPECQGMIDDVLTSCLPVAAMAESAWTAGMENGQHSDSAIVGERQRQKERKGQRGREGGGREREREGKGEE